jgi:hypothetical protein
VAIYNSVDRPDIGTEVVFKRDARLEPGLFPNPIDRANRILCDGMTGRVEFYNNALMFLYLDIVVEGKHTNIPVAYGECE